MVEYTEGAMIRLTATFSFNIDEDVYFEFDNLITRYGTPANDLTIILNTNPKQCHVDIDTFEIIGDHYYHFYSRGIKKAAAKGAFRVV